MRVLESAIRCGIKPISSGWLLMGLFALGTTLCFSSSPSPESIQATYGQGGDAISITLTIYNYTTPSEMQLLSQAFEQSQDQGLVNELSKTKAAGLCSLTGDLSFDVAFIQMVITPTGREITFITNRPLQSDKVNSKPESQSFDLMVGQFDLNDADSTKSTGFLFPASKLAVDEEGEFHYDLAGSPWPLVNILDSNWVPALAEGVAPNATGLSPQQLLQ
jgi:hypothetical protein